MRKKKLERINQIISRINDIDQEHSRSPTVTLYKERGVLQSELDTLTTEAEETLYLRSKQQEFEYGEKASKLLSHHLRQSTEANYIAEIQTAHGVTTDQLSINKQFKHFYEELYTSVPCDKANIASFLADLDISKICE